MLLILHDLCQAYEDEMGEMYRKLGKQVYEEGRLQEICILSVTASVMVYQVSATEWDSYAMGVEPILLSYF